METRKERVKRLFESKYSFTCKQIARVLSIECGLNQSSHELLKPISALISTLNKEGFILRNPKVKPYSYYLNPKYKPMALKKADSRRTKIRMLFISPRAPQMSLNQIVQYLIQEEGIPKSGQKYLSGSISSILRKLVLEKYLKYADHTTARGGHIYELDRSRHNSIDINPEKANL